MTAYARSPQQGVIVQSFERPPAHVVEVFTAFYSGIILDHLGKLGAMSHAIGPLQPGMRLCGPATTCLGPDLGLRRAAIDLAKQGDVLVVAAGGTMEYACFGDGTAKRMQVKGLGGAVIDGSVRDSAGIRALGFPTFCRSVTARNYFYPVEASYGAVNVPVVVGGEVVHPGDLVFGDDDGIVVVPRELASHLAGVVADRLETERAERGAWDEYPPYEVVAELIERGYRFEESTPTPDPTGKELSHEVTAELIGRGYRFEESVVATDATAELGSTTTGESIDRTSTRSQP